jgi:hypothetical protein
MTNYRKRLTEIEKRSPDEFPIVWRLEPGEPLPSWAGDPHVFVIQRIIVDPKREGRN